MGRYKRIDRHFNDCLQALCEKPRRRISPAQAVALVWENSQCVKNQEGKCPLLVFDKQLADALNAFFWDED